MLMLTKTLERSQSGGILAMSSQALAVLFLMLSIQEAGAEQGGPFASVAVEADFARYNPKDHVTGGLKIQGSETMYPLLTRLGIEFQRRQPKVSVDVKGGGSTKAVEEFIQPPAIKTGKITLKEERGDSDELLRSQTG